VLVFPIGFYQLAHFALGRLIIESSTISKKECRALRDKITPCENWKYQRIEVHTNGLKVDVVIMENKKTSSSKRWVVLSGGSGTTYEKFLLRDSLKTLLTKLNAHGVVFNYPGVGESSWWATRNNMNDALAAVVSYVKKHADEFIIIGFSMGGGVVSDLPHQGECLRILDRTFVDLTSTITTTLQSNFLGKVVSISGWNMSPAASLNRVKVPTMILQSAQGVDHAEILNKDQVIHDTVIHQNDTLASHVLGLPIRSNDHHVIGIPDDHAFGWNNPERLATVIQEKLALSQTKS
jgi:hypothetical protein